MKLCDKCCAPVEETHRIGDWDLCEDCAIEATSENLMKYIAQIHTVKRLADYINGGWGTLTSSDLVSDCCTVNSSDVRFLAKCLGGNLKYREWESGYTEVSFTYLGVTFWQLIKTEDLKKEDEEE